jgi:hypothetical protein
MRSDPPKSTICARNGMERRMSLATNDDELFFHRTKFRDRIGDDANHLASRVGIRIRVRPGGL